MSIDLLDRVYKTYIVTVGKGPVGLRGTIQEEIFPVEFYQEGRVCQLGDPGESFCLKGKA